MKKFILGTILSFIAALFCVFGIVFMFAVINAANSPEGIAGIVIIPLAICCFLAQFAFGAAGQALLWTNFAKNGRAKTASMVIAIISAVAMLLTIAVLVYARVR